MEVEHIIKTKHYFELSADELVEVSNYVSSEVEFDDMKSFLLSTQTTFNAQKIKTSKELDKKVLNYLHHSYPQVQPWYNSVLLFLFPRDKQFFKYPAFQIVVASLLVFGVFNVVNFNSFNKTEMAIEDVSKFEKKEFRSIVEKNVTTNEESLESNKQEEFKPITNDPITIEVTDFEGDEKENVIFKEDIDSYLSGKSEAFFNNEVVIMEEELEQEKAVVPANSPLIDDFIMDIDEIDSDMSYEAKELVSNEKHNEVTNGKKRKIKSNSKLFTKDKSNAPQSVSNTSIQTESLKTDVAQMGNNSRVGITIANANSKDKQVSIKTTPELVNLFFEVK